MGILLLKMATSIIILGMMFSIIGGLVTTIDVTVEGKHILKTGVRHYSLYELPSHSFTIRCEVNALRRPTKVSIMTKENTIEDWMQTTTPYRSRWEKTVTLNLSTYEQEYTCRAFFSIICMSAVYGSSCQSVIDSNVAVRFERIPSIGSNVGSIVYLGEEKTLECSDIHEESNTSSCMDSRRNYLGESKSNIIVSHENKSHQCSWFSFSNGQYTICHISVPKLVISPSLNLSLTPSDFSSNNTTLQFNCTSHPPRLMRWTVIIDSGEILDFSSLDEINKVSMNVTIKQRAGETILNIREASAGGNGIVSVRCSSYDTLAKVSASSHRVLIDEVNDVDADIVTSTLSVPSTTSTIKSTQIYQQATTPDYDLVNMATEEQVTEDTKPSKQNCENPKTNFELCVESMYFKLHLILVTTLVCSLVLIVVTLLIKLRLAVARASPVTCDENEKVPSETVLHDNPVYQSYSETAASSTNGVTHTNACTYAIPTFKSVHD